jgi:DNA polymerase V
MTANSRLISLIDANNFYVSCERVFRPDLIGKPVAVLSNNDGCIVSRSQEMKDLGVKMGVPAFQIQHLVKQHNIQLLSSNYGLYADLSARVMSVLETFAPSIEIYSIDEAFLDFTDLYPCTKDPIAYGQQIKQTVLRHTGIPVCVGMGPTKTLAKLANFAAKKWKQTGGVLDLSDIQRREKLMKIVPVGEVWGIGRQLSKQLNQLGIQTVWDLALQSPQKMQQQFSVFMARTIMELNGIACLELEEIAPDKQQIVCSRSFSRKLTTLPELTPAMAEFASRAAEKLRQQHSVNRSPKGADDFKIPGLEPQHKNWETGHFADRFRVQVPDKPSNTVTSHMAKDVIASFSISTWKGLLADRSDCLTEFWLLAYLDMSDIRTSSAMVSFDLRIISLAGTRTCCRSISGDFFLVK